MKMNFPQNQKNHTSRHLKKRLNQDQVRLLEASFDASKKLEPERKFQLAGELGVPPRQIAIWYQNKRARWKNQSLELDYGALHVRLDAALAEKRQLEEEADNLRGELKRARDMLFGFRRAEARAQSHHPLVSSLSSCRDEGAGYCSVNDEAMLQFGELYACLMVGAKGSNCGTTKL
ncbi:hypothetical protein Pfo_022750 [Paulownia fortunei]|nr:hypothetical protein Pfo_022750 [Paulownia fortunei]